MSGAYIDCPSCKAERSASVAGTAGKGIGHIWQCNRCQHRFYDAETERRSAAFTQGRDVAPAAIKPGTVTPQHLPPKVGDVWRLFNRGKDLGDWLVVGGEPGRWTGRCVREGEGAPGMLGGESPLLIGDSDWSIVSSAEPATATKPRGGARFKVIEAIGPLELERDLNAWVAQLPPGAKIRRTQLAVAAFPTLGDVLLYALVNYDVPDPEPTW